MKRSGSTSRGFTLLEVLVASVLVSLVAGAMYMSMYVAFKARKSTVDALGPVTAARVAMDQIVRDVQAMLPPVGVFAGAMLAQDQRNDQGQDADSVSFFNAAGPTQLMDYAGDLQQVQWSLMTASEWAVAVASSTTSSSSVTAGLPASSTMAANEWLLVRQVNRQLLSPVAQEPVPQVYARGVRSLNLRYYDGSQWLDEWDSTTRDNALPVAVEVTLELAPADDARNQDTAGMRLVQVVRPACAVRPELVLEEASTPSPPPEP